MAAIAMVGLIALSVIAAGCGGGGGGGGGPKVALLLPESKTSRYESRDRPEFEEKVEEICGDCEIVYSNASQSVDKQRAQARAALTQGANVLVIDPVDARAAAAVAKEAERKRVPVLSYDRLILSAPSAYYVGPDVQKVGELQAEALSRELREDGHPNGPIVMLNGSPTDPTSAQFKLGAADVLEHAGVEIAREYGTPDGSPARARSETKEAIAALGKNGFNGVYALTDGIAGGAIAAMKAAGIEPKSKPTTGQDAELEAIQRILAEEQFMTAYVPVEPEANAAAEIAVALAEKKKIPPGLAHTEGLLAVRVNNGPEEVSAILLLPVAVTRDNVKSTIVRDGFWSASEICAGPHKKDCEEAGID